MKINVLVLKAFIFLMTCCEDSRTCRTVPSAGQFHSCKGYCKHFPWFHSLWIYTLPSKTFVLVMFNWTGMLS